VREDLPARRRVAAPRAAAVLAASIFHFGQFAIAETKRYLAAQGIHIRPEL
jgi:cyclase